MSKFIDKEIFMPDDVIRIIEKYFPPDTPGYQIYFNHCYSVTKLAVKIAGNLNNSSIDMALLVKGAMLHDIGTVFTNAPDIHCYGNYPYISHGYLGRELLEKEGLPEVAPVCERHIGVGISLDDIKNFSLPIPVREMLPLSIEEKIICFADKFYSKTASDPDKPKSLEKIRKGLLKYGEDKPKIFDRYLEMFGKGIFL